jgi:hypothetical protein
LRLVLHHVVGLDPGLGLIRKTDRGAYSFTEPLFGLFVRELTQPEA